MTGSPMGAAGFGTLAGYFIDRTVVTYDPRGVERSRRTDGASTSPPEEHADDVHRLIAALDAGRGSGTRATLAPVGLRHPSIRASACPASSLWSHTTTTKEGRTVLVELGLAEQRLRAVLEVLNDGASVTDVARRYGVTRQTVHRWLGKYASGGLGALADGSSRPDTCPHQMSVELRR